jgi:acyl carrier protein
MTRKSLHDAVLDVAVKNFTFPPKTFSAYDITKILRDDVNSKLYDIAEFVGLPSRFGQEVSHSQVRDTVAQLHTSGHFDRQFNGTYFEYAISLTPGSTVAPITGIVTPTPAPVDARIIAILANQTGVDASRINSLTTLDSDLGFDDLDLVEVFMALEEEYKTELNGHELPEPASTLKTVQDLVNLLETNIKKNTQTAPAPVAVVTAPAKAPDKSTVLKLYIKARHNKGVSPTLKNAQKALKQPGTAVREISDLAKSLGYNVLGTKDIPFSNWVISK